MAAAFPRIDQQEIAQQQEREERIVVGRVAGMHFGSAIRQKDADEDKNDAVQRPRRLKHQRQRESQRYGDRVENSGKQRQITELDPPQQLHR